MPALDMLFTTLFILVYLASVVKLRINDYTRIERCLQSIPITLKEQGNEATLSRKDAYRRHVDLTTNLLGYKALDYQGDGVYTPHTLHHFTVLDLIHDVKTSLTRILRWNTLINVDYYIDMPNFLRFQLAPVSIYTFRPTRAGRHDDKMAYFFTKNENGDLFVDHTILPSKTREQASHYKHQLWDYPREFKTTNLLFTTYWATHTIRAKDCEWVGVTLTPIAIKATFSDILWPIVADRITRISCKNETCIAVERLKEQKVSVGRFDQRSAVDIGTMEYDIIRNWKSTTRNPYNVRNLTDSKYEGMESAWIAMAIEEGDFRALTINDFCYQLDAKHANPVGKLIINPISRAGFWANTQNEEISVEQRHTKHQDRVKEADLTVTTDFDKTLNETARYDFALTPYGADEVFRRQFRPTQQTILQQAVNLARDQRAKISLFLKKEAYSEIVPPRLIFPVDELLKMDWSRYMYALKDNLEDYCPEFARTYAFGCTPYQLAEKIKLINCTGFCKDCGKNMHVIATDYSKWDASLSEPIRMAERHFLCWPFKSDLKAYNIWDKQLNARTPNSNDKNNARYKLIENMGWARVTGSPDTSLANSFSNWLICRTAFGHELQGVFGGDDGLVAASCSDIKRLEALCARLKLIIKLEKRKLSDLVPFLGRYWDLATGGSCVDLQRQVLKLHNFPKGTTRSVEDIARSRAIGLFATDSGTPFIRWWVESLVKELGASTANLEWDTISYIARQHLPMDLSDWYKKFKLEPLFLPLEESRYDELEVLGFTYSRFEEIMKRNGNDWRNSRFVFFEREPENKVGKTVGLGEVVIPAQPVVGFGPKNKEKPNPVRRDKPAKQNNVKHEPVDQETVHVKKENTKASERSTRKSVATTPLRREKREARGRQA